MLPNDSKQRRQAALKKSVKTLQSTVMDHFKSMESLTPYSDKAFVSTAIEWLVDADLVSVFLSLSSEETKLLAPF